MKKLVVFCIVVSTCLAGFCRPDPRHHGPRPPMHGPIAHHIPPPPPPFSHHHHRHSSGPFWGGVGVGLAASLLTSSIIAPPSPVVIQAAPPKRVWIPPVYGERPIYRAGIYVGVERYIITPGYWTTTY